MLYDGILCVDGIQYKLVNNITNGEHEYIVRDYANNLLLHVVKSKKTESLFYTGQSELYDTISYIEDAIKLYRFKNDEILKDEFDFSSSTIRKIYHAESENFTYKYIESNNVLESVYKRFDNTYIDLKCTHSTASISNFKDKKYFKRVYDTETIRSNMNNIRSLNDIARIRNLDWLVYREDAKLNQPFKDYLIIDTKEALDRVANFLNNYKGVVAFDTETDGLVFNQLPQQHPSRSKLLGMCISWKEDTAIYIPVNMNIVKNIDLTYAIEALRPVLEHGHILTHYGVFDYMVMYSYGITLNILDDTYIIPYIVNPVNGKQPKGLKYMTGVYIGVDQIEFEDNFYDMEFANFAELPYENVRAYAPADADFTLKIFNKIRKNIPKISEYIYAEEIKHMRVVAEMQYYGVGLNDTLMDKASKDCLADIKKLENLFYKLTGETEQTCKITSKEKLRHLLYDKLQYPQIVFMRDDDTKPSVDKMALKTLSEISAKQPRMILTEDLLGDIKEDGKNTVLIKADVINNSACPVAVVLKEYNKLFKWYSSFFKRYAKDEIGGMLFPSFNQCGTDTGRLSSSNPNLQQLVSDWKRLVVPWNNKYYMIVFDFAQIELRVMMSLAKDERLIHLLQNPEADIHRIIASILNKCEPWEIDDKQRKFAKKYNFGIPYAMGVTALAILLYGYPVTEENKKNAKEVMELYLNSMPLVRDMFQDFRDFAQKYEFTLTYFNRVRRYVGLSTETENWKIERDRRRAGNSPIQGTAADIIKIGMNRLYERWKEKGLDAHIVGSVHDEGIVIANRDIHPYELISDIKDCMEDYFKDYFEYKKTPFAPLFTGIAIVDNWGEGKDGTYELPVKLAEEFRKMYKENRLPKIDKNNYKMYIKNEMDKYMDMRYEQYINELGYSLDEPNKIDLNDLLSKFTDVFIAPALKSDYCKKSLGKAVVEYIKHKTNVDLTLQLREHESHQDSDGNVDLSKIVMEEIYSEIDTEHEVINLKEHRKCNVIEEKQEYETATVYDIYNIGRVMFINISGVTKDGITQLCNYLRSISDDKGRLSVVLKHYNSTIPTEYTPNAPDRDKIQRILNENKVVGNGSLA